MWPPWPKIPSGRSPSASSPPTRTLSFSLSFSFKDVHTLARDDSDDAIPPTPGSPAPSTAARRAAIFRRVRIAASTLRAWRSPSHPGPNHIVVYFTSLRVIRKTFEDCRAVRSILRGFRVAVDERDLSMDSSFFEELYSLLGRRHLPPLPLVFIDGRYVGGADEIRQLHETGELRLLVEGAPPAAPGGGCDRCGGAGFVLCGACSGSHKRYTEKDGLRSCAACNENGLVRCSDCSFSPV